MEQATKIPSNTSGSSKAGELGYPTGHLGHLTASQESALVEFKESCVEAGLYKPGSDDGRPPSHNDALLVRFLRARRFVPKDAVQQFRDTEKWRKVNEIDELYENIDIDNYDEARRLYPQWVGQRDKRGFPVYLFEVKPLDSKTMAAYAKSSSATAVVNSSSKERESVDSKPVKNNKNPSTEDATKTPPRLLRLFALYENLSGFMTTLCTVLNDRPHPEVPIVQSSNIVDISGVSLKQFWNLRGHMQDASVLATAHYPETLDRIFIVGAPGFFPTVWSWIKRWFDPITVSKIFILSSSEAYPTLSKFIEPENIPRKFGGTLDYNFGDQAPVDPAIADRIEWKVPIEDSAPSEANGTLKNDEKKSKSSKEKKAEQKPAVRRWPRGPVKWVEREDGDLDLLAVGSEKGVLRREVVARLHLGDREIGGDADPTGPLQEDRRKRAFPGGTAAATSAKEIEAQKDAKGEEGDAPPAFETPVENAQEEMEKLALNGKGEDKPEPALAAASVQAAGEAVSPVPLEAIATAIPGESNEKETEP